MAKKGRQYDTDYPYEARGIKAVLRDIYRLGESRYFNGDVDATVLLTDLYMALDSGCLTPRMRQVVFLYYFVGFTQSEISRLLEISQPTVAELSNIALERIAAEMDYGYKEKNGARSEGRLAARSGFDRPLIVILNEVADGLRRVYDVRAGVTEAVTLHLAGSGDKKAQEAVKQRFDGTTHIESGPEYLRYWYGEDVRNVDEYPALTDDQMRWADRRVSYVPDVYYDDNSVKAGFRKISELSDDEQGGSWNYYRQRLFNKRN